MNAQPASAKRQSEEVNAMNVKKGKRRMSILLAAVMLIVLTPCTTAYGANAGTA